MMKKKNAFKAATEDSSDKFSSCHIDRYFIFHLHFIKILDFRYVERDSFLPPVWVLKYISIKHF